MYEENILYVTHVVSRERQEIARKVGLWFRTDFDWIREHGEEKLEVR